MRCYCYTQKSNFKVRCRKISSFVINNNPLCINHVNMIYKGYVIYIQKTWRSYRKRLFINTVYKDLPSDLQKKIMFYVRENYLIKKHHHDVIKKILFKKFNENFIVDLEFYNDYEHDIVLQEDNIKKLIYIFTLYTKYYSIAPNYNKLVLRKYVRDLYDLSLTLSMMNIFDKSIIDTLISLIRRYLLLLEYHCRY